MGFVDELRDYLKRVELRQVDVRADLVPVEQSVADVAPYWSYVLHQLDKIEAADSSSQGKDRVSDLLLEWRSLLDRFIAALIPRLRLSFAHDADEVRLAQLLRAAIDIRLRLRPDVPLTRVQRLELRTLSAAAWQTAENSTQPTKQDGWRVPARYLHEIRAISRAGKGEVTPIGRFLLALTGRDAVSWLVTIESLLSLGPADEWRVAPGGVMALLKHPEWKGDIDPLERYGAMALSTIRRLGAFGLMRYSERLYEDETDVTYSVLPEARSLLEDIAVERDTLFRVTAKAMLRDLLHQTLGSASSVAEGMLTQARMVAHELNGVLNPIPEALEELFRVLQEAGPVPPEALQLRSVMKRSLDRAYAYTKELAAMPRIAADAQAIDIGECLRKALASLNGAANQVTLRVADELPALVGVSRRLELAITNLLQNALRFADQRHPIIHVEVTRRQRDVVILIEDNGPGVDPLMRQEIFKDGFSLREGGTGHGLALVREVAEELHGSVVCAEEPSHLGGALFRMVLPVTDSSEG